MTNYEKTLELINLQNEIVRRNLETVANSPFELTSVSNETVAISEWQPIIEYPEPTR